MNKLYQASAPGVIKLGPFGPYNNAVWLFHHRGSAALAEMPPFRKGEKRPWRAVQDVLDELGLTLEYALMSHAHYDHCQTLAQFRKAFPETRFVAHKSQAESRVCQRLCGQIGLRPSEFFDDVYEGEIKLLPLGGEPLLLIHCPKHSQSDQFVIFRGTAMTGDWFLGDLKDCNALVAPQEKVHSVRRVVEWLHRTRYSVTRAFSGHGDCLYYDVDFFKLMWQSTIDHSSGQQVS